MPIYESGFIDVIPIHDLARVKPICKPFLAMPLVVNLCKVDEVKKVITVSA